MQYMPYEHDNTREIMDCMTLYVFLINFIHKICLFHKIFEWNLLKKFTQ